MSDENFFRDVGGSASSRLTTQASRAVARCRLARDVNYSSVQSKPPRHHTDVCVCGRLADSSTTVLKRYVRKL